MKKTLLLLSIFAGITFGASAQVCTPDTTHFTSSKHVYPDTLSCIERGQAFSGVVSLQVPDSISTTQLGLPINYEGYIDSIQIDTIYGYPAGISSVSSPVLGTWLKPGQFACALFSGTTSAAAGNYSLTIKGKGCGHATIPVLGLRDTCISNFSLSSVFPYSLKVCNPAGISEVSEGVNLNIYPNPNQGNFTVTVSSATRINGTMSVLDQLGRVINTQSLDVTGTKQVSLALGNVSPGVYILVINTGASKSVKQFIVK